MTSHYIALAVGLLSLSSTVAQATTNEAEGCIISRLNGEKYCLKVGERSGYSLPSWIYAHPVDVQAPSGVSVMLSDWDNLSYNRLAVFDRYTGNEDLKNVKAYNGAYLDFSKPRSMRVLASETYPEACIVSRQTGERFCLKEGERSGYSLPAYIYGHEVDVEAPLGLGIMLSDWDNLSYNRLAVFGGNTQNEQMRAVKAYNGETLDFSKPRSMRVVPYDGDSSALNMKLKWSWQGSAFQPNSNQVMVTPIVAQLNDDNGDGKIDEKDVADLIVVTFEGNKYANGGLVRALSGVDGSELWSYANGGVIADARYSPAVGDLDGDGIVEIVTTNNRDQFITILDNQGNIKKQIPTTESGWRIVGDITLADLDHDGSVEILAADGVYNYHSGLVFNHPWAPSSINVDVDGDQQQEVFSGGTLFQNNGAINWQYQANDAVWFSSLVNLDNDAEPEIVASVPATFATGDNARFAVLEHDGTIKWEINNTANPGGGVQAVSNFLGKAQAVETSEFSKVYGYQPNNNPASIALAVDGKISVRSGFAIDAIGASASTLVGGTGGNLNAAVNVKDIKAIDLTWGKYYWGGYHLLALDFRMSNGSVISMGSKNYAYSKQTERFTVPAGSRIKGIKAWTAGWLLDGVQFELATQNGTNDLDVKGIVYAGYAAVDMYNSKGERVWSVANDDTGSGKIGVSAYDFDNDGIDEVLVQDHARVRVLDGKTGKERASLAHSTATLWEYPIVVDLEGDNNAELIVAANDFDRQYSINHGVYVYQSADSAKPWKNATRIWNQHAFHLTNINQDGTLPTFVEPSWLSHNTYRSSTLRAAVGGESPIFGYSNTQQSQRVVTADNQMYLRSGFAIDAIGTTVNNLVGGPVQGTNGGVLRAPIALDQLQSVEVTSGLYNWGGYHIVAIKFTMKDGSSVLLGSTHYASNKKVETYTVPQGKRIKQINVWTGGWLVEGFQFVY
ncbi:hemolysin [Vibrio cholerae]|uniref:beta-prism lectin domain-containing protein n=1 Tax=Vibrio cholerae TaxID=666 RepID=UPI00155E75B4|nr:beta-prism lectin domain-containing protein [Vibrio cholerae]EGQ9851616.1 hemolysin [Vibrio cholerae]NOE58392.1 hemolysin [Vibrio cholerae]